MMLPPRWEKVLTDLWGNVSRSALVVASIAVGLFAIGVIATIDVIDSHDMRLSYQAIHAANITLQTSLVTDDLIHHVSHFPGVSQAEGVRTLSLRVQNAKGQWQTLSVKAFKAMDRLPINQLRLVEGRWPQEGEIVLGINRRVELNAGVGDRLRIELPDGTSRTLRLVGLVQDQTTGSTGSGGYFNAPLQSYIHPDTLTQLQQAASDQFNGLSITVTGSGSDLAAMQRLSDQISHDLKLNGVDVTSSKVTSSFDHPNGALTEAISGILVILALLSVFLSSFLVTNTLQALLKQQTQQIGIMKSIGARRMQIAGVYLALILAFGLLAFIVAVPLAYGVAYRVVEFLATKLNFVLQGRHLEPGVIGLQGALAVFIPLLAAWQPIWDGTKISVIEALTGSHPASPHKKQSASNKPPPAPRPAGSARSSRFDLPQIIAVRNTFRQKARLLMTLVTLALGGAIFMSTFNVSASVNQYINQIRRYFNADVNVSLRRPYPVAEITGVLTAVPGVGYVEAWTGTTSSMVLADGLLGERIAISAPPADSRIIQPVVMAGRWIKPGDRRALVLSDSFLLHYPTLVVGSPLRLKINNQDTDWVVVGFFQLAGKMSGYVAYANFDYLAGLLDSASSATNYQIVGRQGNLDAAGQEQLKNAVEAALNAKGIRVANLSTGKADSTSTSGGLTTLTDFLLFMAILIALVGSIGLTGTMSMNVMERTREIGILRAVGASDRTLMGIVLSEGLTIGGLSYLLGAALSFPITRILGNSVIWAIFGTSANLVYTLNGFGLWLVVVVGLSAVASLVPARSAAQLTIREVLSYE